MAITLPCYATREEVKRALDVKEPALSDVTVDGAIDSARNDVNGLCHRRFYNVITTAYWDWPNFQRAYPWRVWFDERELADTTVNVPAVTTGGTSIPAGAIFWGPWNYSPPFTYMELDRSQSYSFGVGETPQRDISVTGTFGYWDKQQSAGTLAVALSSSSATTCVVSDGAAVGVGDVAIIGTERCLVQGKAMYDTGLTQQGSGCSTAKNNDNLLAVTNGAAFSPQEVLQLDAEQMLILSIAGNSLTVKRAWNGTVIATHSGAEIYADRQLTITRGDLGSTAATYSQGTALNIQVIPSLVKELAIAEAVNHVLQRTTGYARSLPQGSGILPGVGLPDLRDKCYTAHGRKARNRVV